MKIEIKCTSGKSNTHVDNECVSHDVLVEHPSDDLTATHLARLVFYAILAAGYHQSSVAHAFEAIAEENRPTNKEG